MLHEGGYGFIGQLAVGPDGKAEWVQSERVIEGLSDLFLGGMRGLETKWRQGSDVQVGDVAWAALDVALIAGSVKLVKALALALASTAQAAATGARAAEGMRIGPWALQFLFWFVALSLMGRLALFLLRPLGLALVWANRRRRWAHSPSGRSPSARTRSVFTATSPPCDGRTPQNGDQTAVPSGSAGGAGTASAPPGARPIPGARYAT